MNMLDKFMKNKISRPIAETFPHILPQQVGIELLYVAAIIFIIRMCSFSIFIGSSALEPEDLLGSILTGIGLLGFVLRRRGLSESLASVTSGGDAIPVSYRQRMGWNTVFLILLTFNLFSYFPGDIYYTMDVVIFFIIACTAYLQGEKRVENPVVPDDSKQDYSI